MVSKQDSNPLQRIAQLEQEIASAETQRRHIREQLVVELAKNGESLRTIGKTVGLSHVGVHHIINLHKAGNK
jgi:hypothetical protein